MAASYDQAVLDNVREVFLAERVSVTGKTDTQILAMYFFSVVAKVFSCLYRIKYDTNFPSEESLIKIGRELNPTIWVSCVFNLRDIIGTLPLKNDAFELESLAPEFPYWFGFVCFVANMVRTPEAALKLVRAGKTADATKEQFPTVALKKNLQCFRKEENLDRFKDMITSLFHELFT